MITLAFGALLAATSPGTPIGPALSPKARALIAPVHEAYVAEERRQSALQKPHSDAERLERLLAVDQAGRNELGRIDFNELRKEERQDAQSVMWAEINQHDLQDQKILKSMIPAEGWFLKSKYGEKAATAAFLIVQHAVNDPDLMRSTLRVMERLLPTGEVEGTKYALLYDRVSLEFDHKPQRYGSQAGCQGGKMAVINLEDPAHVDDRRRAVGLKQTEAEYMAMMADFPCPR